MAVFTGKKETGDEEQDLDHERLSDGDVSGEKQNGFDWFSLTHEPSKTSLQHAMGN